MSGYIGNSVSGTTADSTIYLPVRQTVLTGSSSAGVPNFMSAGTGLRVSLSASATPMVIAFANGFGTYGSQDYVARITANNSDMTGADLSAANTNYILATYVNNGSVTWSNTLLPVQYAPFYPQTKQSLLRFVGADASTTILDDYGSTWTANGNAQVDTAVQIDGLNTLLLDGTTDYIESSSFTSFGDSSWTVEFKIRWNTLPTPGQEQWIVHAAPASFFGASFALNNTAGTLKLKLNLSSNGTSADITSATLGTKTAWATATNYHIVLTFDALAGKYFMYVDGVVDQTIVSTAKIAAITKIRIGEALDASGQQVNGAMAGFRFSPCCRYPNGTAFAAPSVATFAVEGHWFDTIGYQMWEATSASGTAGTNPTFTQRIRTFVGEADTSAAAVSAVRNYAYQGRYESVPAQLAAGQLVINHNLGVAPRRNRFAIVSKTSDGLSFVGDETDYIDGTVAAAGTQNGFVFQHRKNLSVLNISSGNIYVVISSGASSTIAFANYNYKINVSRDW